ncbi:MAG: cyclophilin-like fold protein [Candidatus Bathyarchaeota archaeon]|nr:cyclophilin-like fold protein [Candidatus Bathyarchaeota archaeon]
MTERRVSRIPVRVVLEGLGEAEGELTRFLAPRTVEAILRKLPVEGRANVWKEEVYFEVPIKMGTEKAKKIVERGMMAYWPLGNSICIFFGETQPYSPVNVIGKINKNLELFGKVKNGIKVKIEKY